MEYELSHQARQELLEVVKVADALKRLEANPDFQLVITKSFLVDLALSKIPQLTAENLERRNQLNLELFAIGYFENYLANIASDGVSAKLALDGISED